MTAKTTPKVTTLKEWAALGIHRVALPSGAIVRVQVPDMALLLASDEMPEELVDVALEDIGRAISNERPTVDVETLKRLTDLHRFLISWMLVEPKLSYEELAHGSPRRPPNEDIEVLTSIATRERSVGFYAVEPAES